MRTLLLLVFTLSLSACTHYLYQGDFSATNDTGTPCDYRFYWTRTDPLAGSTTAGPGILQSTCSTPKTFVDSTQGIVLELTTDQFQTQPPTTGPSVVCGKILNLAAFQDYNEGDLQIRFFCNSITDDFAVIQRSLPAPTGDPYVIQIDEPVRKWSFGKDNALAPEPL